MAVRQTQGDSRYRLNASNRRRGERRAIAFARIHIFGARGSLCAECRPMKGNHKRNNFHLAHVHIQNLSQPSSADSRQEYRFQFQLFVIHCMLFAYNLRTAFNPKINSLRHCTCTNMVKLIRCNAPVNGRQQLAARPYACRAHPRYIIIIIIILCECDTCSTQTNHLCCCCRAVAPV